MPSALVHDPSGCLNSSKEIPNRPYGYFKELSGLPYAAADRVSLRGLQGVGYIPEE